MMSCGACGYAVRGATTLACSECGADLREVGIHRPKGQNAVAVLIVTAAIAGLLAVGCVGVGLVTWVSNSAPAPAPGPGPVQAFPNTSTPSGGQAPPSESGTQPSGTEGDGPIGQGRE